MKEKVENRRFKLKRNKCGRGTQYFELLFDSAWFTFVQFMGGLHLCYSVISYLKED